MLAKSVERIHGANLTNFGILQLVFTDDADYDRIHEITTLLIKGEWNHSMGEYVKIPVVYMRGGTSKGAYLMVEDLPADPVLRDKVILNIYGSPDARQINGIILQNRLIK